ncbi:MAG: AmmeMemoRadiSam system protein A [Arenicellales bacterium]
MPAELRDRLRDLARASIEHGLDAGLPIEVELEEWPETLREHRATFVTLEIEARLRGCIGALDATRPLVRDVAANAFSAAFRDPRFPPLTAFEFPDLDIHVSVLSRVEPMAVRSEAELLERLRPGIDGLILEERGRRGTFLPAVWRSLPRASEFVEQLKAKAGFAPDYWSESVRAYRYTTEEF